MYSVIATLSTMLNSQLETRVAGVRYVAVRITVQMPIDPARSLPEA